MQTEGFQQGLEELIALSREKRTAIMCAEAVPWRCHRSLVADALNVRGISVLEILSQTDYRAHKLTPLRPLRWDSDYLSARTGHVAVKRRAKPEPRPANPERPYKSETEQLESRAQKTPRTCPRSSPSKSQNCLRELALRLELECGNPYWARAYSR